MYSSQPNYAGNMYISYYSKYYKTTILCYYFTLYCIEIHNLPFKVLEINFMNASLYGYGDMSKNVVKK